MKIIRGDCLKSSAIADNSREESRRNMLVVAECFADGGLKGIGRRDVTAETASRDRDAQAGLLSSGETDP